MFVETIIALVAFGALAGYGVAEVFRCGPLRSDNQALRLRISERAWADETEARDRRTYRKHLGTPYIRTATVPRVVSTGKPGLRIVNGESLYSAEWLNTDAQVNP